MKFIFFKFSRYNRTVANNIVSNIFHGRDNSPEYNICSIFATDVTIFIFLLYSPYYISAIKKSLSLGVGACVLKRTHTFLFVEIFERAVDYIVRTINYNTTKKYFLGEGERWERGVKNNKYSEIV